MSSANLKSQLTAVKDALARHQVKIAQAAPESFPESGGTKTTPTGVFASDTQLKQDNEVPASSRTTAGASEDTNPKLAPSILTGGAPSPDAPSSITPMTSDGKDAAKLNPGIKVASPLGRDLLADIERIQSMQKTAQAGLAAPVQKVAEPAPPSVPAKETQTATAKAETAKPVTTTKVPEEIPAELKPKTAGDVLALTEPMLAKIASICLAEAEGAEFVTRMVTQHMGKEAADRAMSVLRGQHEQIVALEKSAADADERSLYEKLGQEVVDMAMDSALGGMGPADPATGPADMGGMSGGLPGGMPAGDPAMGGEPAGDVPADPAAIEAALSQASPEELEQVIGDLLASGQLSEEDLAAITAALGEDGGAPADAPAGPPAAETPAQSSPSEPASDSAPEKEVAKETAPEGEEKSASAKAKTGAAALLRALSARKGK